MRHLFHVFGNIFILKTNNKTPVLRPKLHSWNFGSLSPGMTTRSTPASVITTRLATPPLTLSLPMAKARAAGTEMREMEDKEEVQKEKDRERAER